MKPENQNAILGSGPYLPVAAQPSSPIAPDSCPECHSSRVWKAGIRYTEFGQVQRYICRDCSYRFSHSESSERSEHHQRIQSLILKSEADKTLLCRAADERNGSCKELGSTQQMKHIRSRRAAVLLIKRAKKLAEVETRTQEKAAGATKTLSAKDEFAEQLKRDGYSPSTIKQCTYYLTRLENKGVNPLQPEHVKAFIAEQNWQIHSKATACVMYGIFAKAMHLQWNPPKYRYDQKIPFVPTQTEMDALIAGVGKKTSTILRVLLETGGRIGEILRLRWEDIDYVRGRIAIQNPEKGSLPRSIPVTETLIGILRARPHIHPQRVFPISIHTAESNFRTQRNRLAVKLGNPRLRQIRLSTFRHFYASMLYLRTNKLMLVKERLGHKSIKNTEIYTHIFGELSNPEYDVGTAETDEERKALIRAGFEFVEQDNQGLSYYRKPRFNF